ncbi:MAG: dihydropteroate synthase [Casimicrobiaceae bacterium]
MLSAGARSLDVSTPRVMGVLNVTADSFSDDGLAHDAVWALARARQMIADGADIIDIGGESTRPGAEPIGVDEELHRIVPLVQALAADGALVSVDTMKPEVMRAAIGAGAAMVNDVRALLAPDALDVLADGDAAVCLMHMQGEPRTMQVAPVYADVVREVREFLAGRARACIAAGIARERIVVDPGFGFGKTLAHNLALLRELASIVTLGFPVLAGLSRKSMLGALAGRDVGERTAASIAAALAAIAHGASIVRVHDVRATVDAIRVWQAINQVS